MKLPAVILTAFLAAACNSQGGGGNGAAANRTAAADAAAPVAMRAGEWEMTMRVTSLEMPGAPPAMLEQLRSQPLPPPQVQRSCVSPESAANPIANFREQITRNQPGLSCGTGESIFAGGRIRVTLTCRPANGQPDQRLAMVGSFTADTVQIGVVADTSSPATDAMAAQPVQIQSTLTGRRLGDCPPGAPAN